MRKILCAVILMFALPLAPAAWSEQPMSEAERLFAEGETFYNAHNYASAYERFSQAAEQGHARAQTNLGYMYETGRGVAKDERQALQWFRKAAEQGETDATA